MGDDLDSTEEMVSIACYSGFWVFQLVKKKYSIISAKNTNSVLAFAKTAGRKVTRFARETVASTRSFALATA